MKRRMPARVSARSTASSSGSPGTSGEGRTIRERMKALLAEPVSGASLAALRISMGLLMMLEAWSLCRPNPAAISMGTSPIQTYYAGSEFSFHFPYPGFEWLPFFPTSWMYALAGLQAIAGMSMALGFRSRASSVLVFLTWGYFFVVESTRSYWQSHYYLELLFLFLLMWMPTGRRFSVDALLAGRRNQPWPRTVPFWTIFVLRGQLVIAYFYAGVAKLNLDWLADAIPVRWFLNDPAVTRPYETILSAGQLELLRSVLHSEWFAYFISYTGLVFDLAVGFLFLFRRTRMFALLLMLIFHGTNHFLIFDDIDWFPLAGATTALIFLDADWPGRVWAWLKKPGFGRPDWAWLVGGAVVFPLVGAILGWRLKARPLPAAEAVERHALHRWTLRLVLVWLTFQTLLPLRHYLIPGDGRFTFEGLSFSWRLKSDRRSARGVLLLIRDDRIIAPGSQGRARIDWGEWHGDPVIYRRVVPGLIDWHQLPELALTLHPLAGERVIFNPAATGDGGSSPAAAREDAVRLWLRIYGRAPSAVEETLPLEEICNGAARALHGAGQEADAGLFEKFAPAAAALDQNQLEPQLAAKVRTRLRSMLNKALEVSAARDAVVGLVHRLDPFVLEGQPRLATPMWVIDDPAVTSAPNQHGSRVRHAAWLQAAGITDAGSPRYENLGASPSIVYTGDMGIEAGELLPKAYILDHLADPGLPPAIYWNSLKDLSLSKSIHISNQAFYLRRYARRVASLWEKDYGRRPIVNAMTAVSFNGRPYQELVDPDADLASVPVTWFGHNRWIRDLQTPRVPPEALAHEHPWNETP